MYVIMCVIIIYMWACSAVMYIICVSVLCVCMLIPPSVCMVACYNNLDSFMRSELKNKRFELVFIVDPIHW